VQIPLQHDNDIHTEIRKTRNGKHIAKDNKAPKEQE
jgi:hypothetical protein